MASSERGSNNLCLETCGEFDWKEEIYSMVLVNWLVV